MGARSDASTADRKRYGPPMFMPFFSPPFSVASRLAAAAPVRDPLAHLLEATALSVALPLKIATTARMDR